MVLPGYTPQFFGLGRFFLGVHHTSFIFPSVIYCRSAPGNRDNWAFVACPSPRPQANLSAVGAMVKKSAPSRLLVDHHLTTPSSQPVPFLVLNAPTFFYTHHKQRRKLCTPHSFRRWIMLFACPSQFSDQTTTPNWTMDD